MRSLESEHQSATQLARVARLFPTTMVRTPHGLGRIKQWDDAPAGKVLVELTMPTRRVVVDACDVREAPDWPVWQSMTPLQRAHRWSGVCCDCMATIPHSAIRCDEHVRVYQEAVREVREVRKPDPSMDIGAFNERQSEFFRSRMDK